MPHIFFEPLEKRQSTQTLFPAFGGNTAIAIYSAPVPEYGVGIGYTPPSNNYLLYGISPYYPISPPSSGYSPWSGGGLFGWSNPFNSYNPWGSWGSSSWSSPWGSGSWSSPFGGFFGGFFGGLFGGFFGGSYPWSGGSGYPSFPDVRLLYGVFPSPTPPTDIIAYYGIGIPSVSSFSGLLW